MEASSTAILLTKDGGVLKYVQREGDPAAGHPNVGDSVSVHYVGRLKENDQEFYSSRKRGKTFKFTLGKGELMWNVGVASMKRGEIADFECSFEYAYGANGRPPSISLNSTLVFNVELVEWHGEDISPNRDGSITKSIIERGDLFNRPSDLSPITVHIVGAHAGRIFLTEELNFILGKGSEYELPKGVDHAVSYMNKGEKCCVTIKGERFTYGLKAPAKFNLPPNAELTFKIFLKDFEYAPGRELTDDKMLEVAKKLLVSGTEFLYHEKYDVALQKYNDVVTMFEHAKPENEELKNDFDQILYIAILKSAYTYCNLIETATVNKYLRKALQIVPGFTCLPCVNYLDTVLYSTLDGSSELWRIKKFSDFYALRTLGTPST